MQVKRFVAADMRRALELVRQELGPDAIILSSKRLRQGVEVLTTVDKAEQSAVSATENLSGFESPMSSDTAWGEQMAVDNAVREHREEPAAPLNSAFPASQAQAQQAPRAPESLTSQPSLQGSQQLADDIERARERMLAARRVEEAVSRPLAQPQTEHQAQAQAQQEQIQRQEQAFAAPAAQHSTAAPMMDSTAAGDFNRKCVAEEKLENVMDSARQHAVTRAHFAEQVQEQNLSTLQAELADMRLLLEQQLGQMSQARTPLQSGLQRRMERLGLSTACANKLLQQLPQQGVINQVWPDALAAMAHQVPVTGTDITENGGVFAFVGPTGVGKTTTIGKLAARYVLKHGADKVALVTTDTYRIAAHDQLRSFGRILNVAVRVVDDSNSLQAVLHSLRNCPLVLIDTAGFRHGDPLLKEQLQELSEQAQVQSYLVLATNSQAQMMKASVHAYSAAELKGCILTKLDETASLGEAVEVVMERQLPVAYVTDGQDIPQDIEVARSHRLVSRAVALAKDNSESFQSGSVGELAGTAALAMRAQNNGMVARAEHLY